MIPVPELDEHAHPALLYSLLPLGVLAFILGAVGIVAVIVGDFERPWKVALFMLGLGFAGFETARRAWKGMRSLASRWSLHLLAQPCLRPRVHNGRLVPARQNADART